jgi:hypothetical protein
MRTRTLLLLAVSCGLVILVAGLFLLLRIDRNGSTVERLSIGDTARAGDLRVTVLSADEADGFMRVAVRVGGVADDSVIDDFRLVVPGRLIAPLPAVQAGDEGCDRLADVDVDVTCDLVFGTAQVEGSARSLLLRRGEDQRRWDLARS